jgi:alkaline phosphatase
VSTSAIGVGSVLFNGYYDNTDVAKKIMSVLGMTPKVYYASK